MNFPKTAVSSENAAPTWNTTDNTVRLQQVPVSSQGITVRYTNTPLGGTFNNVIFVNNTDFTVSDYWTGRITVLNAQAITDLDTNPNKVFFNVSYVQWTPVARLAFFPVDDQQPAVARKNGAAWPSSGNWQLDLDTGIVTVLGNLINGTDTLSFDYGSVSAVSGGAVEAYYAAKDQVVATGVSDSSGRASFTLWSGIFELRVGKSGFSPNITVVDTAVTSDLRIRMEAGLTIVGHARDSRGRFITAGLQATLYNVDTNASLGAKVLQADIVGSLYTFHAPPGTYRMVVDANGYRANATTRTFLTTPAQPVNSVLMPSDTEEYRTTVVYGTSDWNNLTVYRNLTLNPDSRFPGLRPTGLRDIRLQVDFTLGTSGTRDGAVSGTEASAFLDWLVANGPLHTTTDAFLTTNGKSHLSNGSSYQATVEGLTTPGSKVWINTTVTYSLKEPPYVPFGEQKYFVNVTTAADANVSVYQDQVYVIELPRTYEMVGSTVFGPITSDGFTRVTVDPGIAASPPQIRMTIERSEKGTARAKVAGPSGNFHVVNASFENYRAYVANNTTLTFSAEDTTDPVGDPLKANFTWRPYANVSGSLGSVTVYGLRPTVTYNRSGEFLVNLTVVETGGNVTFRNITVFVDDRPPVARIRTNRTGAGPFTGTLPINEDELVRIDGGLSTDLAFENRTEGGTRAGVILDAGYAWDFDGDGISDATGRIVNWSFAEPGTYTVNLTVTDSVGWKSANATMTAIVNDTTAPVPAFDILDPRKEWETTTSLTEGKSYSFNASRTTDNFDSPGDLNYTWTIPGPVEGRQGTNHTFYGMNITFTWSEFNSSYSVSLKVTDTGFGSGKKNSGDTSRSVVVQIDTTKRPDLKIDTGSLNVTPTDPEDGGEIEVRVNVTNKPNRGSAASVMAELLLLGGGQTIRLSETPEWRDLNGTPIPAGGIASGETVTIVFRAVVSGQGNRTIQVRVSDSAEPFTWITTENRASMPIFVRQSTLQTVAFYGAIVGVLALFVFYMFYRRKVRAGEWEPVRIRRRERGEERKPRREAKEEKKRL